MNTVKPDTLRSAAFIANIESNDQIPSLVEPLFKRMGANVVVFPV
jgi:hypothetical protein